MSLVDGLHSGPKCMYYIRVVSMSKFVSSERTAKNRPNLQGGVLLKKNHLFGAMGLVGVLALLAACAGPASDLQETDALEVAETKAVEFSCEPATLAGLDDDSHRAAFYALENGLIESDIIPSVAVDYLLIPALIAASGSGQFDYTMTSLNGLILARELGEIDLRAVAYSLAHSGSGLALYTREDAGIASAEDLAGMRIATPSFGSTGTSEAQIVLSQKYGLDAALKGGDLTWVELDMPTMMNALKAGDIDVGLMWHLGGWNAENDPELIKLTALDKEFREIANGAWPIGAAFAATGEFVDGNLECVNEFQRMLGESVAYAEANHAEFAGDISAASGVPVEFIDFWWNPDHYMFGGSVDAEWMSYADEYYKLAFEAGFIPVYPNIEEITVVPAS